MVLDFLWGYFPLDFSLVKSDQNFRISHITWNIIYWNFSSSVMIWNLWLDKVLTGVIDEDLLEGGESNELEPKRYNGVDVSCSCHFCVLNYFFGVALIYLKKVIRMSFFLSVFTLPSSLVTWKNYVKDSLPRCLQDIKSKNLDSSFSASRKEEENARLPFVLSPFRIESTEYQFQLRFYEIKFDLPLPRILEIGLNNMKSWKRDWRMIIYAVSQQVLLKLWKIKISDFNSLLSPYASNQLRPQGSFTSEKDIKHLSRLKVLQKFYNFKTWYFGHTGWSRFQIENGFSLKTASTSMAEISCFEY